MLAVKQKKVLGKKITVPRLHLWKLKRGCSVCRRSGSLRRRSCSGSSHHRSFLSSLLAHAQPQDGRQCQEDKDAKAPFQIFKEHHSTEIQQRSICSKWFRRNARLTNASCGSSASGLAAFSGKEVKRPGTPEEMAAFSTVGTAAGEGVDETDETADLSTEAGAAFGDGVEDLESCGQPKTITRNNPKREA